MSKYIFRLFFLAVFVLQLVFCDVSVLSAKTDDTSQAAADTERMSGMWVSTTLSLDYPSKRTTDSQSLKNEADNIINNCADMGITDIFFQVRPSSDAFYKSDIFCWSQYLTGSQGSAPSGGFDPLEYFVSSAHSKGMKLHAWVNPYRVTNDKNLTLESLAHSNPARQHPEWVVSCDGYLYYDPAIPEVRELIINGVKEIINNYDVDGIHMDDRFYPGKTFDDSKSYALYGQGMDKEDWRRENVNTLIKSLHDTIKSIKPSVEFGVSPRGIWANKKNISTGSDTDGNESYFSDYADSRKWALEGWVDYLAPQIYWAIGYELADYKTLADWWAATLSRCDAKLYTGLADYRCDGASESSVWHNGKAIKDQLDYNRTLSKVSGEIHFRYKFANNLTYLKNIIKSYNGITATTEAQTETTTYAQVTTAPQTVKPTEKTTAAATEKPTEQTTVLVNNTNDILVFVDGSQVSFDVKPVIRSGRTLVPFRAVLEALGAEVSWNNDTQQVRAVKDNTEISFVIGEKTLLINRKDTIIMDVLPQIISGRSMVPIRAVSESLNAEVNWNNDQRIVTINTKK